MRPTLRRFWHRLFFTLAVFGTLVALFYAEENWRGARAFAAVKRELQARGESLDPRDFIPPPVPDDQNMAMAPLYREMFQYAPDPRNHALTFNTNGWNSAVSKPFAGMPWGTQGSGEARPNYPNWTTAHATDLDVLQRFYTNRPDFPHPAQPQTPDRAVLLALGHYAPQLDAVAQAAVGRPLTRFPVNWTLRPAIGISLPHYSLFQTFITTLRLRACVQLTAGDTAAARQDVALCFRLRQVAASDPSVIAFLVDCTSVGLLMQPIWEGLAARRWSAADLDYLSGELRRINLPWEFQQGLRGERALWDAVWSEDLHDPFAFREIVNMMSNQPPASLREKMCWWLLAFGPRGWYEQNSAVACRLLQTCGIDNLDPTRLLVPPAKTNESARRLEETPVGVTTILARTSTLVFSHLAAKAAQFQTPVQQAIIACALEKYFLDHHAYPAALSTLVPTYLDRVPDDVIDGAPMRYRLTVDGRYQLWSIGWDDKDDGGTVCWPPDRSWRSGAPSLPDGRKPTFPLPDRNQGDWVWQYAPAEPSEPPNNQSRLADLPSP